MGAGHRNIENDKVISNDTAAMYIALCYAGNGQETVKADEFCQEIRKTSILKV